MFHGSLNLRAGFTLSLLVLGWLAPSVLNGGEAELIEQRLLKGLSFLASDELKGRRVGTPEIEQAAEYIHKEFQAAGLQTAVYEDGPFQAVKLTGHVRIGAPQKNTLRFTCLDESVDAIQPQLDHDFRPLAIGGSGQVELPLAFAGYGITAPEYDYDDFQDLDARGKAVVIIRKEPQQDDRDSIFKGRANSKHAYFRVKVENAVSHGAAAVILVNDRHELQKQTQALRRKWQRALRQLASEYELLADTEWDDEQFQEHQRRVDLHVQNLIDLDAEWENADRMLDVAGAGSAVVDASVPVFYCRRQLVDQLLQASMQTTLSDLEDQLDELKPRGSVLTNWSVQAKTELEEVNGRNILGVLDGAGELADETLIIGAHYDHVGMGGMGSLAPWTRAIHNGADDNASGVVALLEIARRLVADPPTPRRRVVFIAFTAEEMGLLGSEHYVREPRFPLSKTVAMLNLDMVGRLEGRALIVQGIDTAEQFASLVESAAAPLDLPISRKQGGAGPSDHATFYRQQIPVMHFYTGSHRDYHRPSDDVHKIDLSGLRRIADLVTSITVELATCQQPPKFPSKKAGN